MVSTLDDGPDGNTYNDEAALRVRLGDTLRFAAVVDGADPDDLARGAIEATLLIDEARFEGTPSDDPPAQTRAFPRDGLTDKYDVLLADGTTPEDVLQAHALLTGELLLDPDLGARISTAATAVRRVKAGSAEVENFAPGAFVAITRFPARVQDLLNPFLAGSGSGGDSAGSSASYGTCRDSRFDDCDGSDVADPLG